MYQEIDIIGNLGKDPEMRFTPSGTPVTSLSVAANRKYKGSDGETVKETAWFRVSVFGKTAEACAQYLHKGGLVFVKGRMQPDKNSGGPRVYQRPDGTSGATYEVFGEKVLFLSGKGEHVESDAAEPGDEQATGAPVSTEDEIPF